MKNQIKYIAALLFGILFVVTACTDKFEYMNTELGAYTPDKQIADSKYGNKMYFNVPSTLMTRLQVVQTGHFRPCKI